MIKVKDYPRKRGNKREAKIIHIWWLNLSGIKKNQNCSDVLTT